MHKEGLTLHCHRKNADHEIRKNMKPLVSILIPTWNRAHFIAEAINSALSQDYRPIEIIVCVDGSTDSTLEVLKKFPDIKVIAFPEHKGMCYARNACLDAFTGSYVQFLNDDDALCPDKFKRQVDFLEMRPEIDEVHSDLLLWDGIKYKGHVLGSPVNHDLRQALIKNIGLPVDFDKSISCLLTNDRKEFRIGDGTNLIRRRVFNSGLRYDVELEKIVTVSADYDMWLQMVLAGFKFAYLPGPALQYRIHPGRMTEWALARKERYINSRKYIYNKFKNLIKECTK